jgi:hypothetical protein
MRRKTPRAMLSIALLGAGLTGLALSAYAHDEEEPDPAPGSSWEPETCLADNFCGHAGGYIPMTYNAVGAAMTWTEEHWEIPMIQYKGRHSEFTARDVYDEACVEAAIISSGYSSWPIDHEEWHAQFPSSAIIPTNIFFDAQTVNRRDQTNNPGGTKSLNPCLRSSFKHLVYGGYNQRQGQTQFVASRFRTYMSMEGSVVWDWAHPDAFKTHDVVFDNVDVVEEDAVANIASFTNSGASRGLHYSIYSLGYATMEDGRVVHIGGHNMQSNSGFRKMNVYNPETNRWAARPLPCNIANWRNDPGGVALGYKAVADAAAAAATASTGNPGHFSGVTSYVPGGEQLVNPPVGAPTWPNCDQHNRDVVDPIHPTNPRYQRWYPSGITLPDNRMVVYGGDDLDESVRPNETLTAFNDRDVDFRNTRIFHAVAEIYNVDTERSIPLENARKVYGLYPAATVVEFGNRPGANDWKLCTFTGEPAPASELPPGERNENTDDAADWRRFCTTPACAEDTRAIRLLGERPSASTDCLDVRGAERDSRRNIPAENHWTHINTAKNEYGYCCGMADIMVIGPGGKTLSHKWVAFNGAIGRGEPGAGTRTADIEMMDWKHPVPQWSVVAQTYQPGSNIHVVPLPDGTVVMRGGSGPGGGTYELRNYTKYQLFNPTDNSVRVMTKTTHLGGLHKTVMLTPNADVISMAGDRTAMVALGDRRYTPGDQDLGVSVAQIFTPPIMFADAEGTLKPRPTIQFAPDKITYNQALKIQVGDASRIKMVSLVRTGAVTHQLANDNRVVILNWKRGKGFNEIVIDTPARPAQSIPGDHMLFVVDVDGTPSKAKHVRLLRNLPRGQEFVTTTRTTFPFPHVHERWQ